MSYDNMDHGEWVQRQIDAIQHMAAIGTRKLTLRDRKAQAEHIGWHGAPALLSHFHHRAFRILGVAGGGIYNAPINWDRVRWDERFLCIPWEQEMSTFDFQGLTALVFLAHHAAIRLSISPNMRALNVMMHQRRPTQAGLRMTERHPTLEQAFVDYETRFGAEHPIRHPEQFAPLAVSK